MPKYKKEITGLFALRGDYTLSCKKCQKEFEAKSPVFRIELSLAEKQGRIWATCPSCNRRGWYEITRYKGPVIYL